MKQWYGTEVSYQEYRNNKNNKNRTKEKSNKNRGGSQVYVTNGYIIQHV